VTVASHAAVDVDQPGRWAKQLVSHLGRKALSAQGEWLPWCA
jgi:hypothetical protein